MVIYPLIEPTEDGSSTLRHPILGDAYHSVRGAVGESMHIFIREGFSFLKLPHVRILEVGFGSGLNAYLTAQAAVQQHRTVTYEALELYPVAPTVVSQLSYAQDPLFMQLHTAPWEESVRINELFTLKKIEASLVDYEFYTNFDLIYFDAFAPESQPELWSEAVFCKLKQSLSPQGGVLVTYSAKGSVKEALRRAGFEVKRLPGALGKRHMVRATTQTNET